MPNGFCRLNDDYYFKFIRSHNKNVQYTGLIVSQDKLYYYVEVDEYCGLIEKAGCWKRGVEEQQDYPVEISGFDSYKKIVYFKFV